MELLERAKRKDWLQGEHRWIQVKVTKDEFLKIKQFCVKHDVVRGRFVAEVVLDAIKK